MCSGLSVIAPSEQQTSRFPLDMFILGRMGKNKAQLSWHCGPVLGTKYIEDSSGLSPKRDCSPKMVLAHHNSTFKIRVLCRFNPSVPLHLQTKLLLPTSGVGMLTRPDSREGQVRWRQPHLDVKLPSYTRHTRLVFVRRRWHER